MTDPEVEHLLRATFSDRETQAPHLSVVRRKPRRHGQATWIAAGAATLAVLTGAIFTATALRSPGPAALDQQAQPSGDPAPGWRWESSLGAQIQVPDTWGVNDSGCGMTDKPTVDRGTRFMRMCFTPEPATKEIAVIAGEYNADPAKPIPLAPTTVDGVSAQRGEARIPDGRYAGVVSVPTRDVAISVRTLDRDLTKRILDSLRLVDVDFAGCSVKAPSTASLVNLPGRPAVAPTAVTVAICSYDMQPRLQASAQVSGAAADELLAAVLATPEGANRTIPLSQCNEPQMGPDLVIQPEGGTPLQVFYSRCGARGITDGQRWLKVNEQLINKLMKPLHTGYSFIAPLD